MADPTNAWRIRLSRGELWLRFFRAAVAGAFFLAFAGGASGFFVVLDEWAGEGWGAEGVVVEDCAKTRQARAEKSLLSTANHATKIMKNRRRYETTLSNYLSFMVDAQLTAEVRAHERDVILGQAAKQFLVQIIAAGGGRVAVALLIGHPALVDVFLQPII